MIRLEPMSVTGATDGRLVDQSLAGDRCWPDWWSAGRQSRLIADLHAAACDSLRVGTYRSMLGLTCRVGGTGIWLSRFATPEYTGATRSWPLTRA